MNAAAIQSDFRTAYEASDRQLRLRHARVGCVLALILMPAGSTLDWVVYPELFWPILEVRWLTDVFILLVMAALTRPWGVKRLRVLGSAWALSCAVAISWMIYISEGANSPYYAGLNLVVIISCLLMPYTLREAAAVCGLVIGMYVTACLLHSDTAINGRVLYNNLYFLVLTAIIAVTSCHYYSLRRVEDFRLRHELDVRNKELAELDRLKSEFFANVSHELRTPLTLILAPIDDLLNRSHGLPPNAVQALTLAKGNALRLLKLINDLLEMVRLDARRGQSSTDLRPVDVGQLARGLAESLRQLARSKRLTLDAAGPSDPVVVLGDPSGLEKVILNLMTNAIKFTPPDGRVGLRWSRGQGEARIDVSDTGIGIPEHEVSRIFERFRQVDGSATRKYQGVGIGLALAREIVEAHGGRLTVQSKPGAGSTFTFRLPLAKEAPAAVPAGDGATSDALADALTRADRFIAPLEASEDCGDAEVGAGTHRVLVVDDEPDMRQFLVSLLAEEYRVLQAVDGDTGLDRALRMRPDLIVLDLMLPGIDGLEVCRRLRASRDLDDARIILLTARGDESSKLAALDAGADDFLTKPFSTVEVRTRLRNLLRTSTLQRNLRDRNRDLESTIRELEQTRGQLIQSEKMNALGTLAAGLLHEINNPLNYTMTAMSIALQEVDDQSELGETLRDVNDGMKRIRDIVTDLRTFAYPERPSQRAPVNVAEIIETSLRFTAQVRHDVQTDVDIACDSRLVGSRNQLTQVLVNLLTNAAKAVQTVRDQREPRISVSCRAEGDRVRISVRDNGVGISPENLRRAFDPFFTTRDVGQGMGLGLSICQTIVSGHGGSITLRSEQGNWTEAVIDLPLASVEAFV